MFATDRFDGYITLFQDEYGIYHFYPRKTNTSSMDLGVGFTIKGTMKYNLTEGWVKLWGKKTHIKGKPQPTPLLFFDCIYRTGFVIHNG